MKAKKENIASAQYTGLQNFEINLQFISCCDVLV